MSRLAVADSARPRRRFRASGSSATKFRSGRIVVIASSTGGPRALTAVAKDLPDELGQGLLIVQHMPAGFTKSLADALDSYCGLKISEAASGDKIRPPTGYVAQGGEHLRVRRHRVELSDEAPIGGLRPVRRHHDRRRGHRIRRRRRARRAHRNGS